MAELLRAFINEESRPGLFFGEKKPDARRKVAYVYSGQGGDLTGCALQLLSSEPLFARHLRRCDSLLRQLGCPSVIEFLRAGAAGNAAARVGMAQAALFSIQVGLTELWRGWGVEAEAVAGHSGGEV